MLLFLMKHLHVSDLEPPLKWERAALECAKAFAKTWREFGQWGQFVDLRNGNVVAGGSVAGGTAIAGLSLASRWFFRPDFRALAETAARKYAVEAVEAGILNGGPGEILKATDSESAFGLLEGLLTLWETTQSDEWIELAERVAYQAASWVVPYAFPFPKESSFGTLQMNSTGTVIANVQNKHSAPGICTASALPLLKLYRATKQARWLELAVEITRTLPQYVSTPERPIRADDGSFLQPGWINERVNLSDWESPRCGPGEVFAGSCWGMGSVLLSHLELPGVYVDIESGRVATFDHLQADLNGETLSVHNPTDYSCNFRILVDDDSRKCLGPAWWAGSKVEAIPARGVKTFSIHGR
jgi:hypothetical protein